MKICKKHGQLEDDQIRSYIRNRRGRSEITSQCKLCHRETAARARNANRDKANAWAREDRKKYPEKYSQYAKTHRGKHGVIRNIREIARNFNISVEYYLQMIKDQDNKCDICNKEETRKNRSGKISALCVDHNHYTNKVRKLLCHACNQVIGHSKESIETLKKAILYLEKHANAE
jgi:hypothetical protein